MDEEGLSYRALVEWMGTHIGIGGTQEELNTGEPYLFALDLIHPGSVDLLRARLNTRAKYDHEHNIKLLLAGASQVGFTQADRVNPTDLMQGSRIAHTPILRFLHAAYSALDHPLPPIDPIQKRREVVAKQYEKAFGASPASTPQRRPGAASAPAPAGPPAAPAPTPRAAASRTPQSAARLASAARPAAAGAGPDASAAMRAPSPPRLHGAGGASLAAPARVRSVSSPMPYTPPAGSRPAAPPRGTPLRSAAPAVPASPAVPAASDAPVPPLPLPVAAGDGRAGDERPAETAAAPAEHAMPGTAAVTVAPLGEDAPAHATPRQRPAGSSARAGHTVGVHCFVVSHNLVWCGTGNQSIDTYTASSGAFVRKLVAHRALVKALCVVPATDAVYSAGLDRCVAVWDGTTCEQRTVVGPLRAGVKCLCVAGTTVMCGLIDGTVAAIDITSQQLVRMFQPHLRAVNCLAVDGQGRLWSGSEDRTIRVMDPAAGKVIATAGSHTSYVTALERADGFIFSGSDDCTVRVWDERTLRPVRRIVAHTRSVTCLKFHEGVVYSGSVDGRVYGWNTATFARTDIHAGKYGVAGLAAFGNHLWIFYVHRAVVVVNIHDFGTRAAFQFDPQRVEAVPAAEINARATPPLLQQSASAAPAVAAPVETAPLQKPRVAELPAEAALPEMEGDKTQTGQEEIAAGGYDVRDDDSDESAAEIEIGGGVIEAGDESTTVGLEEDQPDSVMGPLLLFINSSLSTVPGLAGRIPVSQGALSRSLADGVILSSLLARYFPDVVDAHVAASGTPALCLQAARACGCNVDEETSSEDFRQGGQRLFVLTDEVVQACAYSGLPARTDGLPNEEALRLWAEHVSKRSVPNLGEALADGEVYRAIVEALFPEVDRIGGDGCDVVARATRQLNGTFQPEASALRKGEALIGAATLAELQRLHLKRSSTATKKEPSEEDSLRAWIRAQNIETPVDDVFRDLSNGIALLQLIDKLRPGTVEWSRVHQRPRNKFECIENLNFAVDYLNNPMRLHIPNITGKNLNDGDRTPTLAVLSQLLRYSIDSAVAKQSTARLDAERVLVAWASDVLQRANAAKLTSVRDPALRTAVPLLRIAAALFPDSVDMSRVQAELDSSTVAAAAAGGAGALSAAAAADTVNAHNARYLISCLWRRGLPVLATPQDICAGRPVMLLQLLATMKDAAEHA